MRIRFKTKDNLEHVKECPDVEEPLTAVMSPMWQPTSDRKQPERFMQYRRYEFHGEVVDGIPTVHEV